MTTPPVSFEVKQLLYDKGWRYELGVDETGYRIEHSLAEQRLNEGDLTYVDITIAEIVMWLYEKHRIWIGVICDVGNDLLFTFKIYSIKIGEERCIVNGIMYESPIEAYEAGIEDVLINMI